MSLVFRVTRRSVLRQWRKRPMVIIFGVMVLMTMTWGSTFLIISNALEQTTPLLFMALRYSVALPFLMLIFHRRLAGFTRQELVGGSITGVLLFVSIILITLGLESTLSSKAAFITSLYVVFVPILSIPIARALPKPMTLISVLMSVAGLALLALNDNASLTLTQDEGLVLTGAFVAALHIIALSHYSPGNDAFRLTILQIATAVVLNWLLFFASSEALVLPPTRALLAILYMATFATGITYVGMTWVQQYIDSTKAALFYAMEPVWAVLFGYLAGERLGLAAGLGCALILGAIIVGDLELKPRRLRSIIEPESAPAK